MTIDTRYPPQPAEMAIPLYPSLQKHKHKSTRACVFVSDFFESIRSSFHCNSEQLAVGDSASSLLRAYLMRRSRENRSQRVALPSFSCQNLVDAIIDSGSLPLFYDIENDTSVAESSILYAIEQRADAFIWPVFFGSRARNKELIDKLHDADIVVVYDDAQANPFGSNAVSTRQQLTVNDLALYSYSAPKLLSGSGGGAIYCCHDNIEIIDDIKRVFAKENRQFLDCNSLSNSDTLQRYKTQDSLLEDRKHAGSPFTSINPIDAAFNLGQLKRYKRTSDHHDERYSHVRTAISETLGEQALLFLKDIIDGAPTILAVKVSPNTRYDFMSYLARKGVQTTWYYYPINRISRYKRYASQEDTISGAIASTIVMLPFQWAHSDEQVKALIAALKAFARKKSD